jgi:glycine betaine catabolism A
MPRLLPPPSPDSPPSKCRWLFSPEAMSKAGFDPAYAVDFWDLTNRQDWRACEAVQRGVTRRGFRQAPFSQKERVAHLSMAMVARGYLEGRVLPVGSDDLHSLGLRGVEP